MFWLQKSVSYSSFLTELLIIFCNDHTILFHMSIEIQHHIHIYFSDATESTAKDVYKKLQQHPNVLSVGRFHPKPVGPHPVRQFQIMVKPDILEDFLLWLDTIRNGLDVFIHPLIDDDLLAHTKLVRWLGNPHTLNLDRL